MGFSVALADPDCFQKTLNPDPDLTAKISMTHRRTGTVRIVPPQIGCDLALKFYFLCSYFFGSGVCFLELERLQVHF